MKIQGWVFGEASYLKPYPETAGVADGCAFFFLDDETVVVVDSDSELEEDESSLDESCLDFLLFFFFDFFLDLFFLALALLAAPSSESSPELES